MKYCLRYRHPVTGNFYYYVDLKPVGDKLFPVGCMPHRKHKATILYGQDEAKLIADHLVSLGYEVKIIRYAAVFEGRPHCS